MVLDPQSRRLTGLSVSLRVQSQATDRNRHVFERSAAYANSAARETEWRFFGFESVFKDKDRLQKHLGPTRKTFYQTTYL